MGFLEYTYVVSPHDLENLKAMGITQVHALGDTRYDEVSYRLKHGKTLNEIKKPQRPSLIAGSTWPADEECLLAATSELLKQKKLQLVMVPHEPTSTHIENLERMCSRLSLRTLRYTAQYPMNEEYHVLIIDRVGLLADLYAWGTLAYVGGSMDRKVHSVMEPLAAGLITLVGPNISNNREAQEFSEIDAGGITAVKVCTDVPSLSRAISQTLILNERHSQEIRANIQSQILQRQGASSRLADLITLKFN